MLNYRVLSLGSRSLAAPALLSNSRPVRPSKLRIIEGDAERAPAMLASAKLRRYDIANRRNKIDSESATNSGPTLVEFLSSPEFISISEDFSVMFHHWQVFLRVLFPLPCMHHVRASLLGRR